MEIARFRSHDQTLEMISYYHQTDTDDKIFWTVWRAFPIHKIIT